MRITRSICDTKVFTISGQECILVQEEYILVQDKEWYIIPLASFTKTAERFCWIFRKTSWMSWVLFSLFDKDFLTSFGILLLMEPIISILSFFWFNTNVTMCVRHQVNPSKVLRYWAQKCFNKLFKRFQNMVDTWSDLCYHIKNVCAHVFVNDCFILYIIIRNNTFNQFAFRDFSHRTIWMNQTQGNSIQRVFKNSFKID